MKKSATTIIALYMLTVIATAQETTTPKTAISVRFSPTSNFKINFLGVSDFAVGSGDNVSADLNIGSFSADMIGRYYLNDQLAARFGIGFGSLKLKSYNKYTYSNRETDVIEGNLKQTRINLTPALERRFKNKKLEILTGLGLPIGIIGKTAASLKTTSTYINPNSTDTYEYTFEVPGGFGIGLQSFAGFNFYIIDKFAIGTEISYGIGYIKMGGRMSISENDNGSIYTYAGDELTVKGFSMSPLNGALVLTMNF